MRIILLLSIIIFPSCTREDDKDIVSLVSTDKAKNVPDFKVGLDFINEYVSFCIAGAPHENDTNWISNHSLLTDNFKRSYYNLIDSAYKIDPELGLDFDPIFDGQDFPDKGFVITNIDTMNGYLTVKGKDWEDFILVLRVIAQEGKSLVDGSGVINIPAAKRAKR